jgi:hypothetical protein
MIGSFQHLVLIAIEEQIMRIGAKTLYFVMAALLATLVLGAAGNSQADDKLRWKFAVGEKLDYTMVQDMNMEVVGGPLQKLNTNMHQEMMMTWDVLGVDEKTGDAVIKQKFDQIKMKVTSPIGSFEYDTRSEDPPVGLAARIAPMYKAMTKGDFEITMTSRGEVKDVKIPEEVLTALKNSPGAAAMGDIATEKGFKDMISKGALVLPENAPNKGDSWTTTVALNAQGGGKQTVETKYTYDGTKEVEGVTYAVIKPELKMMIENPAEGAAAPDQKSQPAPVKAASSKIAEQSSDGEVLFNIEKGRLYSTTLQQKVTIDASAAGQTMQQKIDQKIDVKVTPAGEKKEEAAKPEADSAKAEAEKKKDSGSEEKK